MNNDYYSALKTGKNVRLEIISVIKEAYNGNVKFLLNNKRINDYINYNLPTNKSFTETYRNKIISENIKSYNFVTNDNNIVYLKELLFFLTYNIPLGEDYSIFTEETRITKRNKENGFGRAYNILSNEKFSTDSNNLHDKIQYIYEYGNTEYGYSLINEILNREDYSDYVKYFSLNDEKGLADFFALMDNLIDAKGFIARCMYIKKYLDNYNATFSSFNKENLNKKYISFGTTYKKHDNNIIKKISKIQVFTYIFYKLSFDLNKLEEKKEFQNNMLRFKNSIKNLNIIELKEKINKLSENNVKYYDQKIKVLNQMRKAKEDKKRKGNKFIKNLKNKKIKERKEKEAKKRERKEKEAKKRDRKTKKKV
jgi:hypothetical protein